MMVTILMAFAEYSAVFVRLGNLNLALQIDDGHVFNSMLYGAASPDRCRISGLVSKLYLYSLDAREVIYRSIIPSASCLLRNSPGGQAGLGSATQKPSHRRSMRESNSSSSV